MQKIDRQEAFSGTKPVEPAVTFDTGALSQFLEHALDNFSGLIDVRQFKGGQSNPTYLLTSTDKNYVLRRKPPGDLLPSAHAIDREFRVLKTLSELGFPVAKPYVLCMDEEIIGTAFYVMDYVSGRVVWDPHMPDVPPRERTQVYTALNGTIADLHMIPIENAGLGDFSRAEGYVARQIKRWSQQYEASSTATIGEMDRLMDWLPGACPDTTRSCLVHGDFRLDNVILDPEKPEILAVIDWELATLGDPWGDFTYHLMQWVMPRSSTGAGTGTLEGYDLEALGIPGMDTYIEQYCGHTGFERPASLDFYFAYNFFRLAAILQGIAGRAAAGTAASEHARSQAAEVAPLARTAWRFARRAGAGKRTAAASRNLAATSKGS